MVSTTDRHVHDVPPLTLPDEWTLFHVYAYSFRYGRWTAGKRCATLSDARSSASAYWTWEPTAVVEIVEVRSRIAGRRTEVATDVAADSKNPALGTPGSSAAPGPTPTLNRS